MRYFSVCSGIEAASVAWEGLGWSAVGYSEIDSFCCSLLEQRFPGVRNFGDTTKYGGWPDAEVDVLVGGTPCQSFSVAGLRGGMADPRGNLALVYLGLAARYRPRWVLWENVPGVLSSHGGRDFGAFLGGLVELGYGFAYRVLDAQHFGVPQRRRRVFVVGHFGDWRRAAAVLFEPSSLRRDSAARRAARQDVAPSLAARTRGGGGLGTDAELDGALIAHTLRAEGFDASEDGTGRGVPLAFHNRQDPDVSGDVTHPLGAQDNGMGVLAPSLTATNDPSRSPQSSEVTQQVASVYSASHMVRRLTPRECERLQGFPDDWTAITYRGKPAADGPRYKALGNSMAVPVMRWIGERIQRNS